MKDTIYKRDNQSILQTTWETFRVTYEELQEYIAIINEVNPIYSDERIAKQAGFQAIPLPATYPSLFWQAFDIPWLDKHATFILNAQTFTYEEPLLINRNYRGQLTLRKLRNRGNKQWAIFDLYIYDEDFIVATMKTTIVITDKVIP